MSIVVRTLSERVFEIVRERIVTGKLPADTPIRQDALAAELGVSKIPLREALARLEQEGLLTSQANRGYFGAADVGTEQAEEIYALRLRDRAGAPPPMPRLSPTDDDATQRSQAFERARPRRRQRPGRGGDQQPRFPHRAGPSRRAPADHAADRAAVDPGGTLCRRASRARRARDRARIRSIARCSTPGWPATAAVLEMLLPAIFSRDAGRSAGSSSRATLTA